MDTASWSATWVPRDTGTPVTAPVNDTAGFALHTGLPTRKARAYRGQRSKPGLYFSTTTSSHLLYESRTEMSVLLDLDFDVDVVALATQPVRIRWKSPSKRFRVYTPDIAVQRRSGRRELLEVKPQDETVTADDEVCWEAASIAAAQMGWSFRVVRPPTPQRLANLVWLAGYRKQQTRFSELNVSLRNHMQDAPISLERLSLVGPGYLTRPTIYALLWGHVLTTDINAPLHDEAQLTLGPTPWPEGVQSGA